MGIYLGCICGLYVARTPGGQQGIVRACARSVGVLCAYCAIDCPRPYKLVFFFGISVIFLEFSSLLVSFSVLSVPYVVMM